MTAVRDTHLLNVAEPATPVSMAAIGALAIIAALFWWFGYVGHISTDDIFYLNAAHEWLKGEPFIPQSHWDVRHTLNIPLALCIALFGDREIVTAIPSGLALIGLALLIYSGANRYFGQRAAFFAALLFIAMPLVAVWGTVAYPDFIEAFFMLASIAAFDAARRRDGHLGLLVLSGVCAGLAMVTRETAISLIVCYGVLFLWGRPIDRWRFFVLGAGAALPILAEWSYYLVVTGNPFLRLEILTTTPVGAPDPNDAEHYGKGWGFVSTGRFLGPILALFVNQEFGLLFWVGIPATFLLLRSQRGEAGRHWWLYLILATGVLTFIIDSYVFSLRPLPRYFAFTSVAVAISLGVFLARLAEDRQRLAVAGLVVFLAVNVGLLDLENKYPTIEQRLTVDLERKNPGETIYTDRWTAGGVRWFLVWAGLPDRVVAKPPPPGALVVYDTTKTSHFPGKPGPSWHLLRTVEAPRTVTGRILHAVGLDRFLEHTRLARILRPGKPVLVYRVGK